MATRGPANGNLPPVRRADSVPSPRYTAERNDAELAAETDVDSDIIQSPKDVIGQSVIHDFLIHCCDKQPEEVSSTTWYRYVVAAQRHNQHVSARLQTYLAAEAASALKADMADLLKELMANVKHARRNQPPRAKRADLLRSLTQKGQTHESYQLSQALVKRITNNGHGEELHAFIMKNQETEAAAIQAELDNGQGSLDAHAHCLDVKLLGCIPIELQEAEPTDVPMVTRRAQLTIALAQVGLDFAKDLAKINAEEEVFDLTDSFRSATAAVMQANKPATSRQLPAVQETANAAPPAPRAKPSSYASPASASDSDNLLRQMMLLTKEVQGIKQTQQQAQQQPQPQPQPQPQRKQQQRQRQQPQPQPQQQRPRKQRSQPQQQQQQQQQQQPLLQQQHQPPLQRQLQQQQQQQRTQPRSWLQRQRQQQWQPQQPPQQQPQEQLQVQRTLQQQPPAVRQPRSPKRRSQPSVPSLSSKRVRWVDQDALRWAGQDRTVSAPAARPGPSRTAKANVRYRFRHALWRKLCGTTHRELPVINLSSHAVEGTAMQGLALGAKFVYTPRHPTPLNLEHARIQAAASDLSASLVCKAKYADCNRACPRFYAPKAVGMATMVHLPQRAMWIADAIHKHTSDLTATLQAEASAMRLYWNEFCQNNLPAKIRTELTTLKRDPNVVVQLADKNMGICIVDACWYHHECLSSLSKQDQFHLVYDPLIDDASFPVKLVDTVMQQQTDLLSKTKLAFKSAFGTQVARAYRRFISAPRTCVVPAYYKTIKVHKVPVKTRPIVAAHSWVTTPLDKVSCIRTCQHSPKGLPTHPAGHKSPCARSRKPAYPPEKPTQHLDHHGRYHRTVREHQALPGTASPRSCVETSEAAGHAHV